MKIRVGAVVALVLLAGCSGGEIDSTEAMCDEFAGHAKAGLPEADRLEVARSLAEVRDNADPQVAKASETLTRTANRGDGAYSVAADSFAQACFDSGWKN